MHPGPCLTKFSRRGTPHPLSGSPTGRFLMIFYAFDTAGHAKLRISIRKPHCDWVVLTQDPVAVGFSYMFSNFNVPCRIQTRKNTPKKDTRPGPEFRKTPPQKMAVAPPFIRPIMWEQMQAEYKKIPVRISIYIHTCLHRASSLHSVEKRLPRKRDIEGM